MAKERSDISDQIRTENEIHTVETMIRMYCRHKEGNKQLCKSCRELLSYAKLHVSKCPFKADKPTCRMCKVHCYSPDMRAKICEVMRFAGPRMIFYHPVMAMKHLAREFIRRV